MQTTPKTFLSSRGYGLLKSAFDEAHLRDLRKELTVAPESIPGYGAPDSGDASFPVYLESPSKLYIPKCFGLERYGLPDQDTTHPGTPNPPSIQFAGSLRPEQLGPVEAFLKSAQNPLSRGGLLNLPCGMGKTVMGLWLWCRLGVKAMVIVHKDFLLKQWKERIQQYVPAARIGLIKASKCIVEDMDIVVASLQSLSMKTYPASVFASFGFVIIDEVHHCAATVFSKALQKVNFQYALGLSATPNRKDGLTKVLHWFLGDILYEGARRKDVVHIVLDTYRNSDPVYCDEPALWNGKPNVSRMINNVCDFGPRMDRILDHLRILKERESGRRVLLLSDRRNHLDLLGERIREAGLGTVGFYVGGMKEEALRQSESCHYILGTFSMASEGMDIPVLDTLILASPKSDIEQSVGRILRKKAADREYEPLIIDIIDGFGPFMGQARKRKTFYKKHGYVMTTRLEDALEGIQTSAVAGADTDDVPTICTIETKKKKKSKAKDPDTDDDDAGEEDSEAKKEKKGVPLFRKK